MQTIAIITGDLVDSREIPTLSREKLYQDLRTFLDTLKKKKKINEYELFRGDSFQCRLEDIEEALTTALMIRAFMKSYSGKEQKAVTKAAREKGKIMTKGYDTGKYDIRLSVGIGKIDFMNKKSLAQSDGEAFYLSGEGLDQLKGLSYRMVVKTTNTDFNDSIEPAVLLMDGVIQKWTNNQAETILYKLEGAKEEDIARKLKISQSAVNQRTKTAQWYAIEKLITYFTKTLKNWN